MSSALPVSLSFIHVQKSAVFIQHQARRITRTTRTATAKDNENANARPSRISTRAKPAASSDATTAAGGTSRATAGTAASRAKTIGSKDADTTAGKRKREALGEVTALVTNNKPLPKGKDKTDGKKEKFDGVVIKSKPPAARQPLRTVATTRQAAKVTTAAVTKKNAVEDVPKVTKAARPKVIRISDDNAMVVDPPAQTLPSITIRKAVVPQEVVAATRRSEGHRRTSTRSYTATRQQTVEDPEAGRVFKKRRTSSEAPQDDPAVTEEAQQLAEEEAASTRLAAEIEAYAEEPEAHPDDSKWEDLDAGDADDPLMVSDYVVEIFDYLQQVEVIISYLPLKRQTQQSIPAHYHAESKLHGLSERARLEDAWHLD